MEIQVLDQNTINKIAAGEVIERPASVVKELVENAIDAKATAITVEIKEGGISFIRITDNGLGIPAKQIPVAFLRHSTSKIKSVEDLLTVSSLGFRGEALSSIASVAQVELITKTKESFSGQRYVIEGGKEIANEEVGAPDGTTFIVRNLFYNTPVRKKFLKTAVTESGYISALIEHLALSNPNISFRFINNNQNKLHTSGNGNLKEIIYNIYGREISSNLIEVDEKTQDLHITGFVGKPLISRGNRTYENYYVNHRYIKSSVLSRAIEEGYQGFIMQHKYPFVALHFEINPAIIDVNVHPTKMELRFSKNEVVYNFTLDAVRRALKQRELIPVVSLDNKPKNKPEIEVANVLEKPQNKPAVVPSKATKDSVEQTLKAYSDIAQKLSNNVSANTTTKTKPEVKPTVQHIKPKNEQRTAAPKTTNGLRMSEPFEVKRKQREEEFETLKKAVDIATSADTKSEGITAVSEEPAKYVADNKGQLLFNDNLLVQSNSQKIKLIGQLFETYWLIEFEDKFFMMDQHAAHEKVMYEKFMKNVTEGKILSQQINPPMILSLHGDEENVLLSNKETFNKLGFEFEEFGGSEYKVTAMPSSLPRIDEKNLLIEMLDQLNGNDNMDPLELVAAEVATLACKAAIKGNNRISAIEAKNLIDQLMELENPYNCPHGRPTLISMTKNEIEKKFKRIV